ncbi:transcriptional regulator, partial [Pseudomonas syringae]
RVRDEAADSVEAWLANAPLRCIVVTSREPLRAQGEWVHELGPLQVPAEPEVLTAAQAMGYSGVALFVTRARAQDPEFAFNDGDAGTVAAICRTLDGNPLAIELAAARARTFGIHALVGLLDGSLPLQMTGLRTALPRQPPPHATIASTYGPPPAPVH